MATQKYNLIDQNDQIVGFVVLKNVPHELEHTIPHTTLPADGPLADAVLLFASLTGFTAFGWLAAYWATWPLWIAPAVGLTITAILAGIRAVKMGEQSDQNQNGELTIKVESWQSEHVEFSEIQDKTISVEDWRKVADAIIRHKVNFSRPALGRFVSQTTYHKIKDEFVYQGWAERQGNNYTLSPRALDFLLKIRTLPY